MKMKKLNVKNQVTTSRVAFKTVSSESEEARKARVTKYLNDHPEKEAYSLDEVDELFGFQEVK
jgi:hypothetical protein